MNREFIGKKISLLGCGCAARGFCALWISVSAVEKNLVFLPLPYEIEIFSIEEN